MGSNLSCVKARPNEKSTIPGAATDDNVYAEANDEFDAAPSSTSSANHMLNATTSPHPQPPSYPPPVSTKSRITTDHPSNSSSCSNTSTNNTTETTKRVSDSKGRHPVLLPPISKKPEAVRTQSEGEKQAIWHDVNGYAMPMPKSGQSSGATNGTRPATAAPKQKSRSFDVTENSTQNDGVNYSTVAPYNVKTDKESAQGDRLRVKDKKKDKPRNASDTGTYCNVIIADDRSSKSFSNELYEETDVHAQDVPVKARATMKPTDKQEKSQNSGLNYIQIEFVNQTEVTKKKPKVKRTPSPTQYTDVINENGVVRLMN